MANVANSSVSDEVITLRDSITANISVLVDCLNSFEYVTKDLDSWGREVPLAVRVQTSCQKANACIENFINGLKQLCDELTDFIANQTKTDTSTKTSG